MCTPHGTLCIRHWCKLSSNDINFKCEVGKLVLLLYWNTIYISIQCFKEPLSITYFTLPLILFIPFFLRKFAPFLYFILLSLLTTWLIIIANHLEKLIQTYFLNCILSLVSHNLAKTIIIFIKIAILRGHWLHANICDKKDGQRGSTEIWSSVRWVSIKVLRQLHILI